MTTNPTPAPLSPEREAEIRPVPTPPSLERLAEIYAQWAEVHTEITPVPPAWAAVGEVLAELERVQAERDELKKRVAELERPAIEVKRNEIRSSYTDLISQCEQDRDFEGAFEVQCRLREREQQWAAEDAKAGDR